MAKNYISHHPATGHVTIDKYNIDFIRFFTAENFILALLGSILGASIWLLSKTLFGATLLIDINLLYVILAVGGIVFLLFTTAIVYYAGSTKFEALRLASRRGLFTFSVMLIVVILALMITQKIYWEQQFYYFLKYLLTGMIVVAVFAVPFDYGVTFAKGLLKKKRYDSV